MTTDFVPEMWTHVLRHALGLLYDPVALAKSPLVRHFGLAGQEDTALALRRILVNGIEELRPDLTVPAHAKPWRHYHVLRHHFIEQFTQREVARDLGMSIRQLRRLEQDALQVLAEHLARQYNLTSRVEFEQGGGAGVGHASTTLATPSRSEEVAWSHRSFPSSSITVEELITGVEQVSGPLLTALHIRLDRTLPERLPRLAVQPELVRQALLNLVIMAARALPGGWLTISTQVQAREVTLHLTARGLSAVTAPFAEGQTEGLKVTRQLLESTGGRLEPVRVEGTHQFSIEVRLPAEPSLTLLVIDDNPDTLQLLERYTTNTRYHFIGIQDATRALLEAQALLPDLIVLDVMLPHVDGWELFGQLRTHPVTCTIPVIICTIMPQEQLALNLGACDFIRKPVSRLDFLTVLEAQARRLGGEQMDSGFDQPQ